MFKRLIAWRVGHIAIDAFLLYAGFLIAYGLRVGWIFSTDFPFAPFALVAALAVLTWIGFLIFTKYYRIPPRSGQGSLYDVVLSFVGGIIAVATLIIVYYFQRELFFSRLINIYALVFGVIALSISRTGFGQLLRFYKSRKKNAYKTLIIGANSVSEQLIKAINSNPYALYEVIGVIDPYGLKKGPQILGKLDKLTEITEKEGITAIIQCDAYEHTLNILSFCEEHDIKYQFDPALRGVYEKNLRIREIAGQTMISFVKRDFESDSKRKLYDVFDQVLKQVFDVD